ncbi:MAG: MarR family transcriptional regulator [Caulobacter sp.]
MSSDSDITKRDAVEVLRLDRQLCFALYSAANRVTRLYRPLLDALGITYPQYLALLVLWEKSPRTVGEVGEALDLESSTLTPLLKRLETAGLIARGRDPQDERRVIVSLTDAGEAMRDKALEVAERFFCKLDTPLPELVDLRERLKRLAV